MVGGGLGPSQCVFGLLGWVVAGGRRVSCARAHARSALPTASPPPPSSRAAPASRPHPQVCQAPLGGPGNGAPHRRAVGRGWCQLTWRRWWWWGGAGALLCGTNQRRQGEAPHEKTWVEAAHSSKCKQTNAGKWALKTVAGPPACSTAAVGSPPPAPNLLISPGRSGVGRKRGAAGGGWRAGGQGVSAGSHTVCDLKVGVFEAGAPPRQPPACVCVCTRTLGVRIPTRCP